MAPRTHAEIAEGAANAKRTLDKLFGHEHPELVEHTMYRYAFRSDAHTSWRYRTYVKGTAARRRLQRGRSRYPENEHKVQTIRVIGDWADNQW